MLEKVFVIKWRKKTKFARHGKKIDCKCFLKFLTTNVGVITRPPPLASGEKDIKGGRDD